MANSQQMATELQAVRIRVEQAVRLASERERKLGREGFYMLPPRVQNQLSVMQAQALPSKQSLEGLLAAEHNLAAYHDKLRRALDLATQAAHQDRRDAEARRRSTGQWLIGVSLVALLASATFLFYRRSLTAKAAECATSDACADDGLCGARFRRAPAPMRMVCAPRGSDDCSASLACLKSGQCSATAESCLAASDADCADTPGCHEGGYCSAVDGKCVIAKRADCERLARCERMGACTPEQGRCVAGGDDDCKGSLLCTEEGACLEVQGQCVVDPDSPRRPTGTAKPAVRPRLQKRRAVKPTRRK